MIRRSSGQRQEYLSTLILFYVLVRRNKVQEQQKSGKANFKTLRCIHHIKMQWESMEKQLDSSGKNPDFSILSILQEIQKDLIQKNTQPKEPNHLRINVQRHLVEIRWSELHHKRRECQGLRVAVPSRTLDASWSRLRRHGTEVHDMGQWDRTENKMVQQFKETGHPIFIGISALNRGVLKRRQNKSIIHFNRESTNTELLFQTIHSATQLRIYGAATT